MSRERNERVKRDLRTLIEAEFGDGTRYFAAILPKKAPIVLMMSRDDSTDRVLVAAAGALRAVWLLEEDEMERERMLSFVIETVRGEE